MTKADRIIGTVVVVGIGIFAAIGISTEINAKFPEDNGVLFNLVATASTALAVAEGYVLAKVTK